MTVEEVIYRITEIATLAIYDAEGGHVLEDRLLWEFIQEQADYGQPIAQELMKLKEIDFPRWCA